MYRSCPVFFLDVYKRQHLFLISRALTHIYLIVWLQHKTRFSVYHLSLIHI